jgi:hypothetical protein
LSPEASRNVKRNKVSGNSPKPKGYSNPRWQAKKPSRKKNRLVRYSAPTLKQRNASQPDAAAGKQSLKPEAHSPQDNVASQASAPPTNDLRKLRTAIRPDSNPLALPPLRA